MSQLCCRVRPLALSSRDGSGHSGGSGGPGSPGMGLDPSGFSWSKTGNLVPICDSQTEATKVWALGSDGCYSKMAQGTKLFTPKARTAQLHAVLIEGFISKTVWVSNQ